MKTVDRTKLIDKIDTLISNLEKARRDKDVYGEIEIEAVSIIMLLRKIYEKALVVPDDELKEVDKELVDASLKAKQLLDRANLIDEYPLLLLGAGYTVDNMLAELQGRYGKLLQFIEDSYGAESSSIREISMDLLIKSSSCMATFNYGKDNVIETCRGLNTKYHEDFTENLLKTLKLCMAYDIDSLCGRESNLGKAKDVIIQIITDTKLEYLSKMVLSIDRASDIIALLGTRLLLLLGYNTSNIESRYPYISLIDELRQNLPKDSLSKTSIAKISMIGSDSYMGEKFETMLLVSLLHHIIN